jgi:hypothetical protein
VVFNVARVLLLRGGGQVVGFSHVLFGVLVQELREIDLRQDRTSSVIKHGHGFGRFRLCLAFGHLGAASKINALLNALDRMVRLEVVHVRANVPSGVLAGGLAEGRILTPHLASKAQQLGDGISIRLPHRLACAGIWTSCVSHGRV